MLTKTNSQIVNEVVRSDIASIKQRKAEVLSWLSLRLGCGEDSLGFLFNDMPKTKSDMTPLSIPDFRQPSG